MDSHWQPTFGRSKQVAQQNHLFEEQKKTDSGMLSSFKAQKAGKQVSLSGDFIFKDVMLFKPEALIVVITIFISIIGFLVTSMLMVFKIDELKEFMSNQAMEKTTALFGDFRLYALIWVVIPVAVMMIVFLYKFMFFYPNGTKRIVVRAWKNNLARISVETIKDNKVLFDPSDKTTEVYVGNERKCTDTTTGRPIILVEEGEPENTRLHRSEKNPEKFKDENNVKLSTWATATRYQRYIDRTGNGFFSNPTNIILIMVMVMVVVVIILIMMNNGGSGGIMESAKGMADSITARPGVA